MNTYAQVLTYAIPSFVILIIIEYLVSLVMGKKVANSMDTIASLSSGMTNTLKDVLGLTVLIIAYHKMYEHLALFDVGSGVLMYLTCFVLIDFASYWSHRFNHEINLFWNRHIIHHSSEEFNLSCALRQSISGIIAIYFFLLVPLAIIGIKPAVISLVAPLHLFAQFWYHTRLINRMGALEHIIVTPSHHRVHHAINPEYIDKNYAAIFIIWDKMFGTFKEEDPNVLAVYGVKKPVRTWNPFLINFQHIALIARDAWHTNNWSDKLRIWFMPTGWRPSDVKEEYPIDVIDDVFSYQKYMPTVPNALKLWSWVQLIFVNLLMYLMLVHIAELEALGLILYALFIGLSIFGYTSLMDLSYLSLGAEIIKCLLCLYIFYQYQSWFDLTILGTMLIPMYTIGSLGLAIYFLRTTRKNNRALAPQLV